MSVPMTFCHLWNCQRTTPTLTETFNECFVPNCGISRQKSHSSITSSPTPSTSLPNTNAYRHPSSGRKSCRFTECSVCSTPIIVYPCSRNERTASTVWSQCTHSTLSSAPKADLWISADGGQAHIPQRNIRSTLNASEVLNALPTLCALRILSNTSTTPD